MYKNKNNLDALPWLNYLGFSYELNNSIETNEISLELTGKSFNQVLFLEKKKNRNFKEYMSERPNILYWDLENGIIKYQTYKGEIWERINFK